MHSVTSPTATIPWYLDVLNFWGGAQFITNSYSTYSVGMVRIFNTDDNDDADNDDAGQPGASVTDMISASL